MSGRSSTPVNGRPRFYQDEFDLRRILAVLKAHFIPLLFTVIVVLAAGAYLAATVKPLYRSTAILNVEDRTSLINEDLMLTNEIKVLTRDATILTTIPLAIRVLRGLSNDRLNASNLKPVERVVTGKQISEFLKNLRVEQAAGASVIKVSYRDSDPERAALVVNRIVDEFKKFKAEILSRRFDAEKKSVNEEIRRLKSEVKQAETAVAEYKKAHNLSDDIGISMKIRQIGELDTQLTLARSELADADIRWRQVAALQRAGDAEALAAVADSSLIHTLREKQSAQIERIAQLKQEYGDSHPILAEARAKLQALQIDIKKELNYIANSVRGQVTAKKRKVGMLRDSIARLEAQVGKGQAATIKLKDLQRDVESSRRVLEKYLIADKRQGISAANRTALEDPVTVIARGFVPGDAVFPKPGQIMLLATMAAAILGFMAAFFAEHLYPKVGSPACRSVEPGEPALDSNSRLPNENSEVFPTESKQRSSSQSPPDTRLQNIIVPIPGDGMSIVPAAEAVAKKYSGYSQAILRLGDALTSYGSNSTDTLLVTSVNRSGDKISVASGLAALMAERGRKVVVIDLSLGESEPQCAFDLNVSPGMSEVMHNEVPLLKAIQTDIRTHVSFFARGKRLQSNEKDQLLMAAPALVNLLKRYFDLIVIIYGDISPATNEQQFFATAKAADHLILVVEENGIHHTKLLAMLFKSILSRVKDRVSPVLVRRESG